MYERDGAVPDRHNKNMNDANYYLKCVHNSKAGTEYDVITDSDTFRYCDRLWSPDHKKYAILSGNVKQV